MVLKFFHSSLNRVKSALSKTKEVLNSPIRALFGTKIDEEQLDQLEQLFYEADMGIEVSMKLTEKVKQTYRKNPKIDTEGLITVIKEEVIDLLTLNKQPTQTPSTPHIILVIGVNGNGKTTSVAKLAKRFTDAGKQVIIGAADTFRAAAIDQLEIWAKRVGCAIVKGQPKADAAAVVYDTLEAAKARGADIVLIDTAGRLHTRHDLMEELKKIKNVCARQIPGAPHETLLVLDATIGQNAVDQARLFNENTPIDALCLTKLDGTAKGGVIINIYNQLKIPVNYIGTGEGIEDLDPFDPKQFAQALFE